ALSQSSAVRPASPVASDAFYSIPQKGKAPRQCKVLQSWTLPTGEKALIVQCLDNGDKVTIVEGTVPRFFFWAQGPNGEAVAPASAPVPPGTKGANPGGRQAMQQVVIQPSAGRLRSVSAGEGDLAPLVTHAPGTNLPPGSRVPAGPVTPGETHAPGEVPPSLFNPQSMDFSKQSVADLYP